MTKPNNPDAMYAARWIDQRLREIVNHWQPMAEAISDTHRETARVTATDPRAFQSARQLLAAKIASMRGRTIAEADDLLSLRSKIALRPDSLPQAPPEVLAELARLRRLHDEYVAERAAECDWFERAFEYHQERARCEHDGDTPPNPRDYGLGGDDADEEGGGDE